MTSRRAAPLPRSVVAAGVTLPLLLLGVVTGANLLGRDAEEPLAPYAAEVAAAYARINPVLLDLVETAGRWTTGDADDEELRGALDAAQASIPDAREEVEALEEPGRARPAEAMYVASLDLYVTTIDALRAALALDRGDRSEIALLARRVRTLADRVYDRGRAIVDPVTTDEAPGVTVVRADPVPDWDAEGLAPAGDVGRALDVRALDQPDDEAGRRRALDLLVLAEVERARDLGLDDVATSLAAIAEDLPG